MFKHCSSQSPAKGFGARAFSISAPSLWIALPRFITECKSIRMFKKCLETILFKSAFNQIKFMFLYIFVMIRGLRMACQIDCNINVLLLLLYEYVIYFKPFKSAYPPYVLMAHLVIIICPPQLLYAKHLKTAQLNVMLYKSNTILLLYFVLCNLLFKVLNSKQCNCQGVLSCDVELLVSLS